MDTSFISGLASGSIGMLAALVGAGLLVMHRFDTKGDNIATLLEDADQLLGQHLAPLIAALDRHGITLQRHVSALRNHTGQLGQANEINGRALAMFEPAPAAPDRLDAQAAAAHTAPAPSTITTLPDGYAPAPQTTPGTIPAPATPTESHA